MTWLDTLARRAAALVDRLRYRFWLQYQNGNAELLAMYEAVDDAGDCLDSVLAAIEDGDIEEAARLLRLSRDRLDEHALTLKELL